MSLRRLVMDSFILLRAGWSVERARRLLRRTRATHVIVHRTVPDLYAQLRARKEIVGEVKDYYYLYTLAEVQELFANADPRTSIGEAFDLHEWQAATALDVHTDASAVPERAVITDGGRLVGLYDAHAKPADDARKGIVSSSALQQRLLSAKFPEQVPLHESRPLSVSLSALQVVGAQPGAQPVTVAIGSALTIVVQARRGFSLAGAGETTIVVTEEEQTLQFELKAVELGPGELCILALSGGRCLCTIILKPTVTAAGVAVSTAPSAERQRVEAQSAQEPDLSLLIMEGESRGKPTLEFRLKARDPSLGLDFARYGPVTLLKDPAEHFQGFFQTIEALPLKTAEDRAYAQAKLESKGAALFEQVVPQPLQQVLWDVRDRIRTVQVQSWEPWVPWELCKLQGKKDGVVTGGPFFCQAFEITRWLLEVPDIPALRLKNMALVIPRDSRLPYAPAERDYMLSLNAAEHAVKRLPATFLTVRDALAKGEYDGWHFTGHGRFRDPDPNRSAMVLQDRQELTPEDLSGEVRNLGLQRPLVFLNACQLGRGDMSLTDIGGWAAQFLRSGAGAFIGAYWSIYDRAAVDFAEAFYSRILSGKPIGQAVKEARLEIRDKHPGDPTWLAYTVWANPAAAVTAG